MSVVYVCRGGLVAPWCHQMGDPRRHNSFVARADISRDVLFFFKVVE